MKQFHIISVGNSLLTNFKRTKKDIENLSYDKDKEWRELFDDPIFRDEIYNFVKEKPKKHSAELNSFLRFVEKYHVENKDVLIYLFGTNTGSNEICKNTIKRYLNEQGYRLANPKEFAGYFWENSNYDNRYAEKEFIEGIGELVDRVIYLAKKKQEEGFDVYVNPTGGFKAHVVASALAGTLTGSKVYYIHETFTDIILFPPLFYVPKGKEIEVLEILSDKEPRSGHDYETLAGQFTDEIDRLETYELVSVKRDDYEKTFRIQITERGLLYYNFVKKDR